MALKSNTFDGVPEGEEPSGANTAASGDPITVNTPSGTPTVDALAAAAYPGSTRGVRVVGAVGDIWSAKFTQTGALTFTSRILFRVDSTRSPGTAALTFARHRSSAAAVCGLALTTSRVLQFQDKAGATRKNFQSNTALANGWYSAFIQGTIATATTGQIAVQVVSEATGAQISDGSLSLADVDLGTANCTEFHFGKILSGGSANFDFDEPAFDTGTTTPVGPFAPPSNTLSQIKANTFEGGTSGTTVTTANSGGLSGDAFDLVQPNDSILAFSNVSVVNGSLGLKIEQPAGITTQALVYWTWSGSASWFGWRSMIKLSKWPTTQFTLLRLFEGNNYTLPEVHLAITAAGKLSALEEGQTTVTSTGALAAGSTYAMVVEYRVSTSTLTWKMYARGSSVITAQVSVTLVTPVAINSLRYGVGSSVDTGNLVIYSDDLGASRNGILDRTDTGNAPPVSTLSASKTLAEAGGSVTFTADASDPDGTVMDADWTITATNGVTPPEIRNATPLSMVITCAATAVQHQYTVTYTPVDDQGLAGDVQSLTITVQPARDYIYGTNGGTVLIPAVAYEFV